MSWAYMEAVLRVQAHPKLMPYGYKSMKLWKETMGKYDQIQCATPQMLTPAPIFLWLRSWVGNGIDQIVMCCW